MKGHSFQGRHKKEQLLNRVFFLLGRDSNLRTEREIAIEGEIFYVI